MHHRSRLAPLVLLAALASPAHGQAAAPSSVERLVQLVGLEERMAGGAKMMVQVSPFPNRPKGAEECAEAGARTRGHAFYVDLYARKLTPEELTAAMAFFSSPLGAESVRVRKANDARMFAAAVRMQPVGDENPPYSAEVKAAIATFSETSAGRKFFVNEMENDEDVHSVVGDLMSDVAVQCMMKGGRKK